MQRWILCVVLFLLAGRCLSQDIYSFEASQRYAQYLYAKEDWKLASEEYGRLLFMQPDNDTLLIRLTGIYHQMRQPDLALQLFQEFRGDPPLLQSYGEEAAYLQATLFQRDSHLLTSALALSKYTPPEEQRRIQIESYLLRRQWPDAARMLKAEAEGNWRSTYEHVTDQVLAFRPKRPWLAATLSAILPGSGKVYSKNVKEGITSFLFVAAMAYQSYRGFNKQGSDSVTGWIYGGLGVGFYLGNIYGAHQSARNYNQRKMHALESEVDRIIYSRY